MSVYIGVMSGTSLDGLDVAVVAFEGVEERPSAFEVLGFASRPYSADHRERLRAAIDEGTTAEICRLDFDVGRRIGEAVEDVLAETGVPVADVTAIGSHGQTVWHVPPEGAAPGSTLQIGNASVIAEVAGVDVISDFRARDMAAGGHGAPLTAYLDRLIFTADAPRLIQNIGGIGNVTVLPAEGRTESPVAFDTGPGVVLIDGAARALTGESFDMDGRLAAAGAADEAGVEEWLADPFFRLPPPRSTGRELFSTGRLREWLGRNGHLSTEDVLATLTEVTARSIAASYALTGVDDAPAYLCGGGSRNAALAERIAALVAPRPVEDLSALGMDPDAREAIAFALLARQHVLGFPASAPWATGASGPRLLGSRTPAAAR